jgi:hypothetical protein
MITALKTTTDIVGRKVLPPRRRASNATSVRTDPHPMDCNPNAGVDLVLYYEMKWREMHTANVTLFRTGEETLKHVVVVRAQFVQASQGLKTFHHQISKLPDLFENLNKTQALASSLKDQLAKLEETLDLFEEFTENRAFERRKVCVCVCVCLVGLRLLLLLCVCVFVHLPSPYLPLSPQIPFQAATSRAVVAYRRKRMQESHRTKERIVQAHKKHKEVLAEEAMKRVSPVCVSVCLCVCVSVCVDR